MIDAPRIDPAHPLSGHKTLSALPWVQARAAARVLGAGVALLRTLDGDVCEADAANLFVVLNDTVVTPGVDTGVLPGITRARCLEALRRAGRPVEERSLAPDELGAVAEAFLTSSLDGVRPLKSVGSRSLVAPGPTAVWLASCVA